MASAREHSQFTLTVPVDASRIEDLKPGQAVKVALVTKDRVLRSEVVKLEKKDSARATFNFDQHPGGLRVVVGPADAPDETLLALQTLFADVGAYAWLKKSELVLRPIVIHPQYWHFWLRWCRKFTIRGRLLCADGSAVPGAKVCAYDIDPWFFFTSTQLLGCDMTDATGSFSIDFTWCCGYWPWWWWRLRLWEIDPNLAAQVGHLLERNPDLRLSKVGTQPSLKIFEQILRDQGLDLAQPLAKDPATVERIRAALAARLSASPELEALRIWPWAPWRPWWDCNPDVIFRATQDCLGETRVVLHETFVDVRPNIPTDYHVILTANEEACCIPQCQDPPCPEGDCVVVDQICGWQVDQIGGNQTPPLAPEGYLHPGPVASGDTAKHEPFAGSIPVYKIGTMVGVDFYEIVDDAENPLPTGVEIDFQRSYWDATTLSWGKVDFDFVPMPGLPPGRRVVMSREHHEATSGLVWDAPGADRYWSINRNLLVPLDTTKFPDGTYRFKVRGWTLGPGGTLVNPRVLPVCGSDEDNRFALTFDNRPPIPEPGHALSHNCGAIHLCTSEPDCHIIEVRVNGNPVGTCETVPTNTGTLEIDFMVSDSGGHLALYELHADYGVNSTVNLLDPLAGGTLTPLDPGVYVGPTYGHAVAQGATTPYWAGGRMRLTISMATAFPIPCCYQLVLGVYERTIVGGGGPLSFSCTTGWPYRNRSQFTVGVGVCPPPSIAIPGGGSVVRVVEGVGPPPR